MPDYSRVDRLIARVLSNTRQEHMGEIHRGDVLDALTRAHIRAAREGLALKTYGTLTTTAAKDNYRLSANIFKLRKLIRPSTWTNPVELIEDPDVWGDKILETLDATQPSYAFVWNRVLYFYPATPSNGEVLRFFGYKLPVIDLEVGEDPETGVEWDDVLEYFATARLLKSREWEDRAKEELDRIQGQSHREDLGQIDKVQHSSRDIGF
jgi:hypothetical protein